MKEMICAAIGVIGSFFASIFGGWDSALVTLACFMAADYVSGFIVAAVFHKSKKTTSGSLSSAIGWKGLCKKFMILVMVAVAYRVDMAIGTNYIRNMVILGYMANELISITENAGLMGIPLPKALTKAIDILTSKSDPGEGEGK